jgi:tetratricopeptide (TPR) repeat protein
MARIDADVVLELLHGLPLALTQAGSYLRETNMSALTYAKHYDQTWNRLMESQNRFPLEEYGDRSILTTWTISFDQLQKQSEEAASLLKLWGFLDSGEVWYELFAAGLRLKADIDGPTWLVSIAENELLYAETMGLLSHYSLAEVKEGTASHSMHSVLHRWCSHLTEDKEQEELGCLAASLVASIVPNNSDMEHWTKWKRLIPHGLRVSKWALEKGTSDEKLLPSHFEHLGYLLDDEDRPRAEHLYVYALHGYEKIYGPEHKRTLATVANLGTIYRKLGRLEDAKQMLQRALDGSEKILGPEHIDTLGTVNNLGLVYRVLGRLEDAEQMLQRALDGYEKILGPEHIDTLGSLNNLGLVYSDLGRLEDAEQMLQRVLDGSEKILGPEHIDTLGTVNNLGLVYRDLGRLEDAEQMLQRALDRCEKILGLEHIDTLRIVNNLGLVYIDLGRLKKAEKMLQRARNGYEKVVGPVDIGTHIGALGNMWDFGILRVKQGRIEEARHWYAQALVGHEKVYGSDHRECQKLRNNLAFLARKEEKQSSSRRGGMFEDNSTSENGGTSQDCSPGPDGEPAQDSTSSKDHVPPSTSSTKSSLWEHRLRKRQRIT